MVLPSSRTVAATVVGPGVDGALHNPTQFVAPAPQGAHDLQRLGAHRVHGGMDIVVTASRADAVDLCLVDEVDGELTERRYRLHGPQQGRWHGHVPGVATGQLYGLRVQGPWRPERGLRHNPAKILLDPYARAIGRAPTLSPLLYPHTVDEHLEPVSDRPDPRDSLPHAALGALVDGPTPRAAGDARPVRPRRPIEETVVYEAHLQGLTKLHPEVPAGLRGTYAGMAHPAVLRHLTELGVTAVELLPIHAIMPEAFLTTRGLTNYWGYSTLNFFAPEPSYASPAARAAGPQAVVDEVRDMVDAMHAAGLEVILDVVYNHTAEGGDLGPTVSWRGLDPAGYYLSRPDSPGAFWDMTGCGNTLDFRRVSVVRMTLDSMRYWAQEIGVDGFRFDLAVTLGRNGAEFSPHHPLFVAMATDPVLSRTRLIAEPWDLGPSGWRTGQFPDTFHEWNDHFRNTVRNFWLSDVRANSLGRPGHGLQDLATRVSGSGDLYGHGFVSGGRGPLASINLVTAHDGFTLADLTSYDAKHNEANAEDNRDGDSHNRSWNHGVEGAVTPGPEGARIAVRRRRSMRNLLGTMLVSAGTPMITAGDEFGRSQGGNNNAYCQDNEISWLDWELADWQVALRATTAHLLRLRREHPILRPARLFTGAVAIGDEIPDLTWADRSGGRLSVGDWHDPAMRCLQMLRSGATLGGADLLVVFNGAITPLDVTLMAGRGTPWRLVWDSAWETPPTGGYPEAVHDVGSVQPMEATSMRIYLT